MGDDDFVFSFDVWVNPLAFFKVDPRFPDATEQFSDEDFLQYLHTPHGFTKQQSYERYIEIMPEIRKLPIVPYEAKILEKLIWPLHNAATGYIIGNHIGTISLCGMVAEMVAILLFDTSATNINGIALDEAKQKKLFGSTFEKQGQARRINILTAYDIISDEQAKKFNDVLQIRTDYLHLYSRSHNSIETDAKKAFGLAIDLVSDVLGVEIKDGKIRIRDGIARYLLDIDKNAGHSGS